MKSFSMPKFVKPLVFAGVLLTLPFLFIEPVLGLDIIWPLPTPAPGENPATFPVPRLDWLDHFKANLDRVQGKNFALVFDGDSITDFWQSTGKDVWAQHYAALNATDFGISGDRTEHLLWRLQQGQINGITPKLIVLMIGTNNTKRDSASQIADGIKAIVAEYRKRCPEAHILLLAVFPRDGARDPIRSKIADINKSISVLDDGTHVTYLDIGEKFLDQGGNIPKDVMPDGLHPSAKGYQIWADAIQPVIDKYCK